jgi:hypothetical protein
MRSDFIALVQEFTLVQVRPPVLAEVAAAVMCTATPGSGSGVVCLAHASLLADSGCPEVTADME